MRAGRLLSAERDSEGQRKDVSAAGKQQKPLRKGLELSFDVILESDRNKQAWSGAEATSPPRQHHAARQDIANCSQW